MIKNSVMNANYDIIQLLTNNYISDLRFFFSNLFSVKIHDLQNIRELTAIIELEQQEEELNSSNNKNNNMSTGSIDNNLLKYQLQWSDDGQLMAICTPQKLLHVFLSQLPLLASLASPNSTNLLARLTSLLEVTVEPIPNAKVITTCIRTYYLYVVYFENSILIGMNKLTSS